MTTRTFYKTFISIEVLSEDPIPAGMELVHIANEANNGSYSMQELKHYEKRLNGKQAAKALLKQASDPEFFRLTITGDDV